MCLYINQPFSVSHYAQSLKKQLHALYMRTDLYLEGTGMLIYVHNQYRCQCDDICATVLCVHPPCRPTWLRWCDCPYLIYLSPMYVFCFNFLSHVTREQHWIKGKGHSKCFVELRCGWDPNKGVVLWWGLKAGLDKGDGHRIPQA